MIVRKKRENGRLCDRQTGHDSDGSDRCGLASPKKFGFCRAYSPPPPFKVSPPSLRCLPRDILNCFSGAIQSIPNNLVQAGSAHLQYPAYREHRVSNSKDEQCRSKQLTSSQDSDVRSQGDIECI